MKKVLVPITLLALVAILFSSCSNSSKLAFTKRHYRNGYFVDRIGKVNTKENPSVARIPIRANRVSHAQVILSSKAPAVTNIPVLVSQKPVMVEQNTVQLKTEKTALAINSALTTPNPPALNTNTNKYSDNEDEHEGHARVDANLSFVVVVLCAIFIPPLGVALAYGIDSYFWIDLILTLIFFFPGMIFALIVVLS